MPWKKATNGKEEPHTRPSSSRTDRLERQREASMDGQFIQMSSVALHLHQGTVRETMVTVLYALDSVGNVWKLIDQGGQKWTLMTNER
jgi:hypothetical protein